MIKYVFGLCEAIKLGWRVGARGTPLSKHPTLPAPPIIFLVYVVLLLALVGCGAAATGDPGAGQRLFNGEEAIADGQLAPCSSCHAVTPEGRMPLGPNLSNIGLRAGRTVPGQSTETYLRTSIIEPDAYLAEGYQEGIMPRDYGRGLSSQQISDLVAYMETLRSGVDD